MPIAYAASYAEPALTLDDYIAFCKLPENADKKFEFVDGYIYAMASPSVRHSRVFRFIYGTLFNYLKGKPCELFAELEIHFPLKFRKTNVLRPDLFINCKTERLQENFCLGAPEFVVEIVSPSSMKDDYYFKREFYLKQGVREYWIVDYKAQRIMVHTHHLDDIIVREYTFSDKVPVSLYEDLEIDFSELPGAN